MKTVEITLNRAARRHLVARGLRRGGSGLFWGLVASVLLLAVDRLLNWNLAWRLFVIGPAAGLLGGAVFAWFTKPSRDALARRLDHALHLKDRIGTAAALDAAPANPRHDPAFATLVHDQAQQLAQTLDVRRAIPVRLTAVWWPITALAVGLVGGFMFVPALQRREPGQSGVANAALTAEQQAAINQQSTQLSQSLDQARAQLPDSAALDDAARSQLEALDRIARQLADPKSGSDASVDAARDESAARLNELADEIAARAERERQAAAAIAQQFQGLDQTGAPAAPMSAEKFSEALTRGDFGEAARQLDQLLDAPDLSEADRQATAEHLRRLAKELGAAKDARARDAGESSDDKRAAIEKTLREQGLDDQTIRRLLDDNAPADASDQIRKELDNRGVDPDIAERIASEADAARRQQQLTDQIQRDAEQARQALDRAADQIGQPNPAPERAESPEVDSPPPPQATTQPLENPQSLDGAPKPPESANPAGRPSGEQRSEQQPEQADRDRPADATTRPAPPESSPTSAAKSQTNQADSQSPQQQTPSASQTQPETPATQPAAQQQEHPTTQPGDQATEAQTQVAKPDPSNTSQQPQAQSQPQQSPGQPQSQPSENGADPNVEKASQAREGGEKPGDLKDQQPSEVFRRLAERAAKAAQDKQTSEQIKKAAREIAEPMTPEQREQWAKQWQREHGSSPPPPMQQQQQQQQQPDASNTGADDTPPGQTESLDGARAGNRSGTPTGRPGAVNPLPPAGDRPVDLRGEESADQLIAEWLGNQRPDPADRSNLDAAGRRVRAAQDVAERAVNDAAVQKRYHKTIKRYFGRLNETLENATNPAPPVVPSPSAPPAAPPAPTPAGDR